MTIEILSDEVVARIAAGEAVERPASAAKELIENSIDAGASSIHVEIAGGGRQLLRVTDNGAGIRKAEIELAFKRHATSKLRAAEELQAVATLGFRGEALASIAAVSQTTIVTRHRDQKMGVSLKLDAGIVQQQRSIGVAAGTVVTIENLFYNTPARLKFLKADNTEKRHIHWVVARYALAYPQIAFVLKGDGRERFRSSGSGKLEDVVGKAFGLDVYKSMIAVNSAEVSRQDRLHIQITGFTSSPALSRATRDRIILFVNGRAIQDSRLSHAITQAYEGLLKTGRHPLAVLLITMPADFVDVNVHPTKAEVRFRDSQQVFVAVQRAVREALIASSDTAPEADLWTGTGFTDQYIEYQRPRPPWQVFDGDELFDDAGLEYTPAAAEQPDKPRTLPVLRVIGQIGASYIIAEGPAGLYLVDQNAAHERVLYEQIQEELAEGTFAGVKLGESQSILLSPEDAQLLGEIGDIFATLGFELEVFGPNSFVVRALPKQIIGLQVVDILPQMLAQLRQSQKEVPDAVAALAAAAAVRSGQILQAEEMGALIAQLERCPTPFNSPNGRKTLIHLSREQLLDEFRRS